MIPSFESLLSNSASWAVCKEFEGSVDPANLGAHLFHLPCIQLDFSGDYSFEHIKESLLACCSPKGECLDYDGDPFLALPDYSVQIAEWHYDGISSLNKDRVPDWIFLIHSGDNLRERQIKQNGFAIANCHLLYSHLTDRGKGLIAEVNQIIFGHRVGKADLTSVEKADLRVKLIDHLLPHLPIVRAHIPFPDTVELDSNNEVFYCYPDELTFCFEGLSWADQRFLLADLQSALSVPGVTYQHSFDCHSLLAVHNKSCFHSARQVEAGARRSVFRLQLIETL